MAVRSYNQIAVWAESQLSSQTPKILQVPSPSKTSSFYKSWGVILTDSSEAYSVCLKSLKLSFLSDSIKSISCNSSMAVLISFTGQAFVVGSDPEEFGLLGIPGCYETSMKVILPGVKCTLASVGQTHVALIDRNGSLYTWGSGHLGELGGEAMSRQQPPSQVASAKIYSVKQVACGPGFTVFCTAGGFLYAYGQLPACPAHSVKSSSPTAIKGLDKLFIQSIVSCDEFIAILTDSKDVYAVHGCLKLVKFPNKYKAIAGGKNGLFGNTKEENCLHEWRISGKSFCKLQSLEAKSYIFDQIFDESVNIYSGESFSIGFSSLIRADGFPITKFYSTIRVESEPAQGNLMELRRKSVSINPFGEKESTLKKVFKIHSHHSLQLYLIYFNELKEFTKLKKYSIVNKSISALINAIAKVIQRNKVVLESKALKDLIDFSCIKQQKQTEEITRRLAEFCEIMTKVRKHCRTGALKIIVRTYADEISRKQGIEVMQMLLDERTEKRKAAGFVALRWNVRKIKRISCGLEKLAEIDVFLLKDRGFAVLFNILNAIKTQINVINHIFFFTSFKNSRILVLKYFDMWKRHRVSSKMEEFTKMYVNKTNARGLGMKLSQMLKKNCKFALNCIKTYQKPASNGKYGLIIILSSLKKIQSRLKVSAFKAIHLHSKIKLKFIKILRSLVKKKFSIYFSSLQSYLEERKQYSLLKIVLKVSSLYEKLDYKNLVKGFSKLKSNGNSSRCSMFDSLNRSNLKLSFKSDSSCRKPIKALTSLSPTSPFAVASSPTSFSSLSKGKSSTLNLKKKADPSSSKTSKTVSFTKLINKSRPVRKASIGVSSERENFENLIDKIFEAETPVMALQTSSSTEAVSGPQSIERIKSELQEDPDVKNRLACVALEGLLSKMVIDELFKQFYEIKSFRKTSSRKLNLKFLESDSEIDECAEDEISSVEENEVDRSEGSESKGLWVEQLQSLGAAVVKKIVVERLRGYFKLVV